jgi:hypothetical protein
MAMMRSLPALTCSMASESPVATASTCPPRIAVIWSPPELNTTIRTRLTSTPADLAALRVETWSLLARPLPIPTDSFVGSAFKTSMKCLPVLYGESVRTAREMYSVVSRARGGLGLHLGLPGELPGKELIRVHGQEMGFPLCSFR